MNDELANIWQDQATQGIAVSVDEIKQRALRLKAKTARRRTIGLTCSFLSLVSSCAGLLFFGGSLAAWFMAAQFISWLLVIVFAEDIFRGGAAVESRVLTLNMLAAVPVPCVEFYRRDLELHLKSLRFGRGTAIAMIPIGIVFVWLSTIRPKNFYPLLSTGLIAMEIGLVWYLQIRREAPRVQAEFDEVNGNLK